MKILASLILFISSASWAYPQAIYTNGFSSGFCQGNGLATFCLDQLKNQAQDNAFRDASVQCQSSRGQLVGLGASCSTYCNPAFIPQGQNAVVNCQAGCSFNCEIPN